MKLFSKNFLKSNNLLSNLFSIKNNSKLFMSLLESVKNELKNSVANLAKSTLKVSEELQQEVVENSQETESNTEEFKPFNCYFLTTELEIQMIKVTENNKEKTEEQIKRLKKADNYFETLPDVISRKTFYLKELGGK